MQNRTFYIPKNTPAIEYAACTLHQQGHAVFPELRQDTTHILLPIPSKDCDRFLDIAKEHHLTVIGGNLPVETGTAVWDLLKDVKYLARNAEITADCTETLIRQSLPCKLSGCEILIIGWGRIGMCLSHKLSRYCQNITICTHSPQKAALCESLGYATINAERFQNSMNDYRVIINTAPADCPIDLSICQKDAVLIDLASVPGIFGENVLCARGIPGKMEPEESGSLIAETVLSYLK